MECDYMDIRYAVVSAHLGNDYIQKISCESHIKEIEKRCETCGDSDYVEEIFDTLEEAEEYLNKMYERGY